MEDYINLCIIGANAIFAYLARKAGWWLISRATRAERRARRIEREMIMAEALKMEITR